MSKTHRPHKIKRRLGLSVLAHMAAIRGDIHQVVRENRVGILGVLFLVILAETENHTRLNLITQVIRNGSHGMDTVRRAFKQTGMVFVITL